MVPCHAVNRTILAGRLGHEVVQELMRATHLPRIDLRRHGLHAVSLSGQQQARKVRLQGPRSIGVADHLYPGQYLYDTVVLGRKNVEIVVMGKPKAGERRCSRSRVSQHAHVYDGLRTTERASAQAIQLCPRPRPRVAYGSYVLPCGCREWTTPSGHRSKLCSAVSRAG